MAIYYGRFKAYEELFTEEDLATYPYCMVFIEKDTYDDGGHNVYLLMCQSQPTYSSYKLNLTEGTYKFYEYWRDSSASRGNEETYGWADGEMYRPAIKLDATSTTNLTTINYLPLMKRLLYTNTDILDGEGGVAFAAMSRKTEEEYLAEYTYRFDRSKIIELADEVRRLRGYSELLLSIDQMTTALKEIERIRYGYDVKFYNGIGKLVASTHIRRGGVVSAPTLNYDTSVWKKNNTSTTITCPFTPEEDVSLYLESPTNYADMLYQFFNVDKTAYPYIWIYTRVNDDDSDDYVTPSLHVFFIKSLGTPSVYGDGTTYSYITYDETNILMEHIHWDCTSSLSMSAIVDKIIATDYNVAEEASWAYDLYTYADGYKNGKFEGQLAYTLTNFDLADIGVTGLGTVYRLDTEVNETTTE